MTIKNMTQKTYFKTLQWGIYASFLGFLLFSLQWLFPYTTLKQIYFNILMEVLAVVWLALMIKYPAARPKKSWITGGLAAWLVVLLVTCLTGVDFNLSFWGDANRMQGWFHLVHFFMFYLILITVFKTKDDWRRLFVLVLSSAVLIVLYSLLKKPTTVADLKSSVNLGNNISTLGNATYVAGVMLVCFYLVLRGLIEKGHLYYKLVYATAGILVLVGFFYADVSGSQAGLAVSLIVFGLLYAFLAANKRIKKISLLSLGIFVVVLASLFALRNAPIFDNRFGKIFRDFSTTNINLNTRFYAWNAGWLGFLERPVLGWGYGNFGVIFDKFFSGDYYRYTMTEEYFDRAHNNLIDLAATSGVVGVLAYLSIFAALFVYLIRGYRQGKFVWLDLATGLAILTAYFIHNLAVFDSWANYFLFFLVAAWVYSLYQGQSSEVLSGQQVANRSNKPEVGAWLIGSAVALFLIFNYNAAFAKNFRRTIVLTDMLSATPPSSVLLAYYQEPFKLNTPMDRSSIDAVSDYLANHPEYLDNLSIVEKRQVFDYFIALNRKVVDYNPDNSLSQTRLARTLMTTCLTLAAPDYCRQVFEPAAKSMATGGQHISVYLLQSITQLYLDDADGAIATLRKALSFYNGYTDAHCQLAQIYLAVKQDEAGKIIGREHLKQCLAGGGGRHFVDDPLMSGEAEQATAALKAEEQARIFAAKEKDYADYLKAGLEQKARGDAGDRDAYYQAIVSFQAAASVSEDKVWIPYLNLGNLFRIVGDYDRAEFSYNKALEISGGEVTVYLAKLDFYSLYAKKTKEEINNLYQEALKTVVLGNANLMIHYAGWLRDNGYTTEAIKAYESLLKSFPDNQAYQEEINRLKK